MKEKLQEALLSGFYIPDIIDVYVRDDDFRKPKFFVFVYH